jgi:hypothetical protein
MIINSPNRRRIFIRYCNSLTFQAFSFSQKKDGDIYCSWPNFNESLWLKVSKDDSSIAAFKSTLDSKKLSLHRSGITKYYQNDNLNDSVRIEGMFLIDHKNQEIGARHLFTIYPTEPKKISINSLYGKREGDVLINSTEYHPFVLMFFAIPQQPMPLKPRIEAIFNINDFPNGIPNIGCESFSLAYHNILWVAYRTKNMDHWPLSNLVSFHDGYYVPTFLGDESSENENNPKMKVGLEEPHYQLNGVDFKLTLKFGV